MKYPPTTFINALPKLVQNEIGIKVMLKLSKMEMNPIEHTKLVGLVLAGRLCDLEGIIDLTQIACLWL